MPNLVPATKTKLHRVEWDHPHLGKVSETVCQFHESDVFAALRTLGIGAGGCVEWESDAQCHRCSHPKRMRVRAWLEEALVSKGRSGILDDRPWRG